MSTEIATLHSHDNEAVSLTSFSGGTERGACLQLTQLYGQQDEHPSPYSGHVQLTKDQVLESVKVMTEWLADH